MIPLDEMIAQVKRKIARGQLSYFGMCMAMTLLKDLEHAKDKTTRGKSQDTERGRAIHR